MKPETIRSVFTNLLFVIGVVLLVVGFTRGTLTVAHLLTFNKYPLNGYDEGRCIGMYPQPVVLEGMEGKTTPLITDGDSKRQKEECLLSLENERKIKKVEDIVSSTSLLVSGLVLTFVFRRFLFGLKQ